MVTKTSGSREIRAGSRTVVVSNAGKTLFPRDGITKADLADYYRRVGTLMIPFLEKRALTMQRFPDGIDGDGFFQKEAPGYFPQWITRATLPRQGGKISHVVADDPATLVYLADQGCITPHVALSTTDRPDHPDRMVFDLDPASDDIGELLWAALRVRRELERLDLRSFVKTTGSRGLHVEVPLDLSATFDEVRRFARALAERLADAEPERLTAAHRKDQRRGRLFIDYLRNAYGQTTVAPYAVRPLDGAPVATPLDWAEVARGGVSPQSYRMDNIFRRLGQKDDPWRDFSAHRQSMAKAAEALASLP